MGESIALKGDRRPGLSSAVPAGLIFKWADSHAHTLAPGVRFSNRLWRTQTRKDMTLP